MNYLILGNGGREHSLGWKLSQSSKVDRVYYIPGNAGMLKENKSGGCYPWCNVDFYNILQLIKEKQIDVVIPGNEQLLYDGITDYLYENGFKNVFGPTKTASIIEWDKFWASDLMLLLDIPHAYYFNCNNKQQIFNSINEICNKCSIQIKNNGFVLKARGLKAGKGVKVFNQNFDQQIVVEINDFVNNYGISKIGNVEIQVCERLIGKEFSVFGVSDGKKVVVFPYIIKDCKQLYERDLGPNTGGMGSYNVKNIYGVKNLIISDYVRDTILQPIIGRFNLYKTPYIGFIYAGMIELEDGSFRVLEFNSRLGDPETQSLLMLLDTDLSDIISGSLNGNIPEIKQKEGHSICIVMSSVGYPDKYDINIPIDLNIDIKDENVKIFHSGTKYQWFDYENRDDNNIYTNGGRVLNVVAYDKESLSNARQKAYKLVKQIEHLNPDVFYYRKDIGGIYDEKGYFKVDEKKNPKF